MMRGELFFQVRLILCTCMYKYIVQPLSLESFKNISVIYISSWDEMGKYDIPAMIDKIIEKTGEEKIFYIGHSMGTTGFMAMANDRPQYQKHIHLATFLAPVAFVEHMASPIKYLAPFVNEVEVIKSFIHT